MNLIETTETPLGDALLGRRAYHATPLHYLPSILADQALYAKDVLAVRGITPRQTAVRRDRMLNLGCYVHFSLRRETPLLMDKLRKGYPHVVLVFDAAGLVNIPGACLLSGNTKAWRSKSALRPQPWADTDGANALIGREVQGRLGSLEILIKYAVDFDRLLCVLFSSEEELAMIDSLVQVLGMECPAPLVYRPIAGVAQHPESVGRIAEYLDACASARAVLRPPCLRFD